MKTLVSHRAALLLRPGRNHAVAARVRDRLPQMLVLIFENVHHRILLRPVSSEQFHSRLQVVVGKSCNRFLQIDVRSPQGFLHFLRISDGRGRCPRIRCARKHAGEQAVLFNDQVEDVGDGANALGGLPVVLARHHAREPGEFVGKRSGIFCQGGLHSCRLRLRQRHHQSDRKRAHSVLSQNLHHVELLYVTTPAHWTICREEPALAGKVTSGVRNETSGQSWSSRFSYNSCRRVDTPIAAGQTKYGTDEMDFDPVCVDDCRTAVHGAADRGGEGSRRAGQLGVRRCDRTRLLERMGGVHTACDCSGETVPVDGAEVCISYSDPYNRVVPDGSPGICHRILSEPWTSGTPFSHNRSWCTTPSSHVHRQCCIDEPHRRDYVLVSYRTVSVDPLLPGRYGAPDSSGAAADAAFPRRT